MYECDSVSEIKKKIILKKAQEEYESQGELPEEFIFKDAAGDSGYGIPLILLLPFLEGMLQKCIEIEIFLKENFSNFIEYVLTMIN